MKKRLLKKRLLTLVTGLAITASAMIGSMSPSFAVNLDQIMGTTPSGIEFSDLEHSVDEYVSEYIGKTVPGAAIAVVKDGEIIFSKGYGYMDEAAQKPVDSESTIFEWGSITKIFTWTSAMQLAEEGLIDLDEDVRVYLPESFVEEWDFEQTVTMRHLMNHTAGFGDYGFDLIYDNPDMLGSLEEDLLKAHPEQYIEVGSASAYSNYGTALAGLVIENVSGMSYDDYLKENFYDVLNMNSTTADRRFDVSDDMKERKAKGYKPTGETGYAETIWSYVGQGPAGSLNGTVGDLAQFAIALTPEDNASTPLFENRETLDNLLTPSYMMTANGFFEFDGQYQSFGHGGNTAGFTGQFAIVPEERFGVVTLTNVKGEINIGYGIQEMLIGKKAYAVNNNFLELPDAEAVEGEYISYRRFEGSFLEAISYTAPLSIEKIDENEIKVSLSGLEAVYVQTEPYTYKITGRDIPLFNMAFPIMKFDMEDGKVKQLTTGHGFDMAPVSVEKGKTVQMGSLALVGLNAVLAIIGLIIAAFVALKDRKRNITDAKVTMKRIHFVTVALMIATLANNILCLGSFLSDSFRTFESMTPHIIVNYILVSFAVGLAGYTFKYWSNEEISKKYRVFVSGSMLTLAGLFVVLLHWNFFVIY